MGFVPNRNRNRKRNFNTVFICIIIDLLIIPRPGSHKRNHSRTDSISGFFRGHSRQVHIYISIFIYLSLYFFYPSIYLFRSIQHLHSFLFVLCHINLLIFLFYIYLYQHIRFVFAYRNKMGLKFWNIREGEKKLFRGYGPYQGGGWVSDKMLKNTRHVLKTLFYYSHFSVWSPLSEYRF